MPLIAQKFVLKDIMKLLLIIIILVLLNLISVCSVRPSPSLSSNSHMVDKPVTIDQRGGNIIYLLFKSRLLPRLY